MTSVEAAIAAAESSPTVDWEFKAMLDEASAHADRAEQALQARLHKQIEDAHDADIETRGIAAAQKRLTVRSRRGLRAAAAKEFERVSGAGARRGNRESKRQKRARARRKLKDLY